MVKSKRKIVWMAAQIIVLVMLILAIVGVCIAWVSRVFVSGLVEDSPSLDTLSGIAGYTSMSSYRAMLAFAIITVVLVAATAALTALAKLFGGYLWLVLLIVSALCLISGIVCIITTDVFCDNIAVTVLPGLTDLSGAYPAPGAWLTAVGAMISGIVGAFASFKA